MFSKTKAIVLSKLKYKDNDLIVKCYTLEHGIISFLVKGVFKSKKSVVKLAYFQLFSQLVIVFNYKSTSALHFIKEVKPHCIYSSLHSHILKSTVVLFLSEIVTITLQEEEKNEQFYGFIETTLLWFDEAQESPNFHLLFLLKLTRYLGFYPDTFNSEYDFFDLQAGYFTSKNEGRYILSGENLLLLRKLLHTNFDTLYAIKLGASQRQSFLNMILLYFELHLGSFKKPKSLQIFNQVFN